MYVCLCRAVTDSHIRREVADGARTMSDLNRSLGVGSQCGKCGRCARQLLREALCTQGAGCGRSEERAAAA